MAHIVSVTQPPSGALGDEWYNPTTSKLYKLVVGNGTNVVWQDFTPFYAANIIGALSAGQNIILAANGQISANVSGTVGGAATNAESTFTAKQIFQGNTAGLALKIFNAAESITVSGISPGSTGNTTVNIDLANASVFYFTTAATSNWNVNFRLSPSTFLNSALANNESISAVVMVTQGSTPYYANGFQIDGVTYIPKWQDATSPTVGNALSVDVYNYNIIKTANVTYTVLGSQTRFA